MLITLCPSLTSLTKDVVSHTREQAVIMCTCRRHRQETGGPGGLTVYWLVANPKFPLLSGR